MSLKEQAVNIILQERSRQDIKWGYPQYNTPFEWMSILTEEVGELATAINDAHLGHTPNDKQLEHIKVEASHVSAVAMSMIEHLMLDKEGGLF